MNFNVSNLTFEGKETISLSIDQPISTIQIHCYDLMIHSVKLDSDTTIHIRNIPSEYIYQFEFNRVFQGQHQLDIQFSGKINPNQNGIFSTEFQGETYIGTSSEPIYARMCFPCFDEPSFKAPFVITIICPSEYISLSNMPIESEIIEYGNRITTFRQTPPMSTYLVSFSVGKFKYKELMFGSLPIRVYVPPSLIDKVDYILYVVESSIKFYTELFGKPYPLPKLDLVGYSDLKCLACALESWGNLFFMFKCLLSDDENIDNRLYVTETIAHELAHQWFGDLVSIEWWNHLWLKEAMAQYTSNLALSSIYQDNVKKFGNIFNDRFNVTYMFPAMEQSLIPSNPPIVHEINTTMEIEQSYTDIVYLKGASVIRMIHRLIGDDSFKKILKIFLDTYQYTHANTQQFLQIVRMISGDQIHDVMNNWLYNQYIPIIKVDGNNVMIIPYLKDQNWIIPFVYTRSNRTRYIQYISSNVTINDIVRINEDFITPMLLQSSDKNLGYLMSMETKFLLSYIGMVPIKIYLDFIQQHMCEKKYYYWYLFMKTLKKIQNIFKKKPQIVCAIQDLIDYFIKNFLNKNIKKPISINDILLTQIEDPVDICESFEDDTHSNLEPINYHGLICTIFNIRHYIDEMITPNNQIQLYDFLINKYPQFKYTIDVSFDKYNMYQHIFNDNITSLTQWYQFYNDKTYQVISH